MSRLAAKVLENKKQVGLILPGIPDSGKIAEKTYTAIVEEDGKRVFTCQCEHKTPGAAETCARNAMNSIVNKRVQRSRL